MTAFTPDPIDAIVLYAAELLDLPPNSIDAEQLRIETRRAGLGTPGGVHLVHGDTSRQLTAAQGQRFLALFEQAPKGRP